MNEAKIQTEPRIGKKIIACMIDYLIIFSLDFYFMYSFGAPNDEGGYSINGLPGLVPILFWVIMTVGLEQWIGATLGNTIVGLKPVSINGIDDELTIKQSFMRHLLDPVDMFFFGVVGVLVISNSDNNQRVGDIVAKTIVVKV